MAKRRKHKQSTIPLPTSPTTGRGPSPGTIGFDPFGYPAFGKGKHGGHKFFAKLLKNAPPFMADTTMYQTAISSINDILSRHGQLPPEILQRSQAALEAQRQNAQRGLAQRAAQTGMDPSSMQYSTIAGGLEQSADRAQQGERFNNAVMADQRQREDLNLVIPWMQMLMGYTAPKSGSQITPAPIGQPKTDWAQIGGNLLGTYIAGAAPKQGQPGWDWGFSK